MLKRLWQITEFPFQPTKLNYHESIFTVGNGYCCVRGSFEEGFPDENPASFVHGIYNRTLGEASPELVNLPNWLEFKLFLDHTAFEIGNPKHFDHTTLSDSVLGFRRTLDLRTGRLTREVLFRTQTNKILRVSFERFACWHDKHLMVQRVSITAIEGNSEVMFETGIDADVTNQGVRNWMIETPTVASGNEIGVEVTANESEYVVGVASSVHCNERLFSKVESLHPIVSSFFTLEEGQTIHIDKFTAIYTSRESKTPMEEAQNHTRKSLEAGYEITCHHHDNAWESFWDVSDVQIEGDEVAQIAVRFGIYHLAIAAPRELDYASIPARTLSGYGYRGHVLWDAEIFAMPVFTLVQPDVARNMLLYRFHTLPAARKKAQEIGCDGALYAWQSTVTGVEVTPTWVTRDGENVRNWAGERAQHIGSDIAYATYQYWRWTGDDEFMLKYGAEIILSTAAFWGSRAVQTDNGQYEIPDQIGPDDYHHNISNNVYTNRMVIWHLQTALKVMDWLEESSPKDANRLAERLDLSNERIRKWQDIIDHLVVPFDEAVGIHVQFDRFFEDYEQIDVAKYQPRIQGLRAILGHERVEQSQIVKQADIILLIALLGEAFATRAVQRDNWNTYFPRTDHATSLSLPIHAWVAARQGLTFVAYDLFEEAAGIDLQDRMGDTAQGVHTALCGGIWQAIVFGFCGLTITADGKPSVRPNLPQHWKLVEFTIMYHGKKWRISVKNDFVEN